MNRSMAALSLAVLAIFSWGFLSSPQWVMAEEEKSYAYDEGAMVLFPATEFYMGSPKGEERDNEYPRHKVSLDSFRIDVREVTNARFAEFVDATGYVTDAEKQGKGWIWDDGWREQPGANWRHPNGPSSGIEHIMDHPVVQVSWNDASAYCLWAEKRLPTEAEWECSCRAGTTTQYSTGNAITHNHANYSGTGGLDRWDGTSPAGSFPPNARGLYDMHGNVWEWCRDYYEENYYEHAPEHNPVNRNEGPYRVMRGGAWDYCAVGMRSAHRGGDVPNNAGDARGFRCVRAASGINE